MRANRRLPAYRDRRPDLAEELQHAEEDEGQDVIAPVERPLRSSGGLVILKGNIAPEVVW